MKERRAVESGVKGLIFLILILVASNSMSKEVTKMDGLKISSEAFGNNTRIPAKYTCDGKNMSPPLLIENIPTKTKSLALIVDDPDAPGGMWVHWVVWNIPADTRVIKENSVPQKAQQGVNDFKKNNYGGPCPPRGTHRYFFKLYALDITLDLSSKTTKTDLERAMQGHIIEQANIVGLYQRE